MKIKKREIKNLIKQKNENLLNGNVSLSLITSKKACYVTLIKYFVRARKDNQMYKTSSEPLPPRTESRELSVFLIGIGTSGCYQLIPLQEKISYFDGRGGLKKAVADLEQQNLIKAELLCKGESGNPKKDL